MKCPKCKTGIMIPEDDFDGLEISRGCLNCGERTYTGFTIRQPIIADADGEGPRINAPRRLLTAEEKTLIATKLAAGISIRQIAKQINRSESSVAKHAQQIALKQEANHA